MTNPFRTLDDAHVSGKRVLLRVDLNVPTEHGRVTDTTRIERVASTIKEISEKGGKVILLAHFGRPKGGPDEANSLRPVAKAVADIVGRPVAFAADCIGQVAADAIAKMRNGEVLLLENTRFHKGEEKNDPAHVAELAKLGDLYVNDAFSAAHRAHASTEGLAHKLPAYCGRAMQKELEALTLALGTPARPVAAIVGGAKVSTKLELLGNLVNKVDILIIGGGMANTFLFAQGKAVGKSLCEKDLAETARSIVAAAEKAKCRILLPVDATVAKELKAHTPAHVVDVDHVAEDEMILDIGPKSVVGRRGGPRQDQDAGLERPARRLRDAAVRRGDDGDRENGRVADQGRQVEVGRGRRRHRRRAQRGQASPTISPMSRLPAARSSSGWKARRCRASRRCGPSNRGGSPYLARSGAAIGVGKAFASPPSEPCVRFSRTRLSSRWFPHRECLAWARAVWRVNSPASAKKALGQR